MGKKPSRTAGHRSRGLFRTQIPDKLPKKSQELPKLGPAEPQPGTHPGLSTITAPEEPQCKRKLPKNMPKCEVRER